MNETYTKALSVLEPMTTFADCLQNMQQVYLGCPERQFHQKRNKYILYDSPALTTHFESCQCCLAGIKHIADAVSAAEKKKLN